MMNLTGGPTIMDRPTHVLPLTFWPGAVAAIEGAMKGAEHDPPLAFGLDCPDGSSILVEYQLERQLEVVMRWPEIYQNCGSPPLLSVLVIDGQPDGFRRSHMAHQFLTEIWKVLGERRPTSLIGASVDETASRRRYFWRVS